MVRHYLWHIGSRAFTLSWLSHFGDTAVTDVAARLYLALNTPVRVWDITCGDHRLVSALAPVGERILSE